MIRKQRNKLVEARAELILADELAAEAFAVHFKAQLRRGQGAHAALFQLYTFRPGGRGPVWPRPSGDLVIPGWIGA
jgi:hypothetical protein